MPRRAAARARLVGVARDDLRRAACGWPDPAGDRPVRRTAAAQDRGQRYPPPTAFPHADRRLRDPVVSRSPPAVRRRQIIPDQPTGPTPAHHGVLRPLPAGLGILARHRGQPVAGKPWICTGQSAGVTTVLGRRGARRRVIRNLAVAYDCVRRSRLWPVLCAATVLTGGCARFDNAVSQPFTTEPEMMPGPASHRRLPAASARRSPRPALHPG